MKSPPGSKTKKHQIASRAGYVVFSSLFIIGYVACIKYGQIAHGIAFMILGSAGLQVSAFQMIRVNMQRDIVLEVTRIIHEKCKNSLEID